MIDPSLSQKILQLQLNQNMASLSLNCLLKCPVTAAAALCESFLHSNIYGTLLHWPFMIYNIFYFTGIHYYTHCTIIKQQTARQCSNVSLLAAEAPPHFLLSLGTLSSLIHSLLAQTEALLLLGIYYPLGNNMSLESEK